MDVGVLISPISKFQGYFHKSLVGQICQDFLKLTPIAILRAQASNKDFQ